MTMIPGLDGGGIPRRAAAILGWSLLVSFVSPGWAQQSPFESGIFSWKATPPLVGVGAMREAADPWISLKDPTFLRQGDQWHVFATLRMQSGAVDIAHFSFGEWEEAADAERHVLGLHDKYYCAPQVFWFRPHRKWYLIYQLAEPSRDPPFGPCFSTTEDLDDPASWSTPEPMITQVAKKLKWLDFWVICDEVKAHLFYTSLNGHLWRRETRLEDFPFGWGEQELALKADLFEASHTYKLKGREEYLTLVEAQAPGRRYYKAYLADRLEGPWRGLADSIQKPFAAAPENVKQEGARWTDCISHGELVRSGIDERMEVDPDNLQFLFQGASREEYSGSGAYGRIPWRLGLLTPANVAGGDSR